MGDLIQGRRDSYSGQNYQQLHGLDYKLTYSQLGSYQQPNQDKKNTFQNLFEYKNKYKN